MYADDTAILVKGKTVDEINRSLNTEFDAVNNWFSSNKLSVNKAKTKCMLFSNNRFRDRNTKIDIQDAAENSINIEHVEKFKYLGVWLDPHLTFEQHAGAVSRKVKSRTFILKRMRNYISEKLALELYQSLINPHFMYADVVYDGGSKAALHEMQIAQNNALRVVKNVDGRFSATALHNQLHVDWLDVARQKRCCIDTYKALHKMTPARMQLQFPVNENVRNLRSNADLTFTPKYNRTVFADRNFGNRCHRYWSQLNTDAHVSPSLNTFKNYMRKFDGFNHAIS